MPWVLSGWGLVCSWGLGGLGALGPLGLGHFLGVGRLWGLVYWLVAFGCLWGLVAGQGYVHFSKLTWLVLGGDPAARSHKVEQFTAL